MKIDLLKLVEEADGSAVIELELDEEAKEFLLSRGINDVLREALKSYKPVKQFPCVQSPSETFMAAS